MSLCQCNGPIVNVKVQVHCVKVTRSIQAQAHTLNFKVTLSRTRSLFQGQKSLLLGKGSLCIGSSINDKVNAKVKVQSVKVKVALYMIHLTQEQTQWQGQSHPVKVKCHYQGQTSQNQGQRAQCQGQSSHCLGHSSMFKCHFVNVMVPLSMSKFTVSRSLGPFKFKLTL